MGAPAAAGALDLQRSCVEPRGLAQFRRLVSPLPREIVVLTPEVSVRRRLLIDRTVKVEVAPTFREADGLAMSSRNKYLDGDLRRQALALWGALQTARAVVAKQRRIRADALKQTLQQQIEREPATKVDYIEFFNPSTLVSVETVRRGTHMALAVFVGKTRLIDNSRL